MAARTTAFSSYKTYLMCYNTTESDYKRLCNIKKLPDLGGSPEALETTTLSNSQNTYTPGLQTFDQLSFTANYTTAMFDSVAGVCDNESTYSYAVFLGDDGEDGKFYFDAIGNVFKSGVGVNEVQEMTVTLSPATDIVKDSAPATPKGATFTPATDSNS
ncbi:MAG: phage tail protein [Clostridia bacterium]|nr:phage tail protein [Clostridia bacterium]